MLSAKKTMRRSASHPEIGNYWMQILIWIDFHSKNHLNTAFKYVPKKKPSEFHRTKND